MNSDQNYVVGKNLNMKNKLQLVSRVQNIIWIFHVIHSILDESFLVLFLNIVFVIMFWIDIGALNKANADKNEINAVLYFSKIFTLCFFIGQK